MIGELRKIDFVAWQIATQEKWQNLADLLQLVAGSHAGARIDQHCRANGLLFSSEKGNLLRLTVLEQCEILCSKPADNGPCRSVTSAAMD